MERTPHTNITPLSFIQHQHVPVHYHGDNFLSFELTQTVMFQQQTIDDTLYVRIPHTCALWAVKAFKNCQNRPEALACQMFSIIEKCAGKKVIDLSSSVN